MEVNESTALAPASQDTALSALQTVEAIVSQVNLIQQVMARVMKEDVHYGTIPGCGDKKALLKPGAEKLCMTFKLRPIIGGDDVVVTELGGGHREYSMAVHLLNNLGEEIATGLGSCTTMESKYRYRSEKTGQPVPGEYWDDRDPKHLGGATYRAKKLDGKWEIVQQVEHDNPADYYNTCLKMSKKRASVDATLSGTAASDMFTQDDIEGMEDDEQEAQAAPIAQPRRTSAAPRRSAAAAPSGGGNLWTGTIKQIDERSGKKKDGSTWTVYNIVGSDGTTFSTFSDTDMQIADGFIESGQEADIRYEMKGQYMNVLSIEAAIPSTVAAE